MWDSKPGAGNRKRDTTPSVVFKILSMFHDTCRPTLSYSIDTLTHNIDTHHTHTYIIFTHITFTQITKVLKNNKIVQIFLKFLYGQL